MILFQAYSAGVAFAPDEAQPTLVVDPDAVLARAVPLEALRYNPTCVASLPHLAEPIFKIDMQTTNLVFRQWAAVSDRCTETI
jgi:hypothetical protein